MSFLSNITWSPLKYKEAAVLAREAGEEMLSRLDWVTLKPRVIVDVGCGVGEFSALLQKRYPDAHVIALDSAESMLAYARQQTPSLASLCADTGQLPLRSQSVDLIFANFLLPWQEDWASVLQEWRRVLRPEGILMLTAFGPDTLQEWQGTEERVCIPHRMDMHDIGDALLQEGFADPVLDVNHYTMIYRSKAKLMTDLIDSGMLKQPVATFNLDHIVTAQDGIWPLTYEIIYAHAFAPASMTQTIEPDGAVKIPLSQLRQQLKSGS